MPEGPEVWREAAAIARVIEGEPILTIEFAWPSIAQHAKNLDSARIDQVRPRGKAMTLAFSTGFSLVTHNQLYGKWVVRKTTPPTHRKALRVLIQTARGTAMLYSAPTRSMRPPLSPACAKGSSTSAFDNDHLLHCYSIKDL